MIVCMARRGKVRWTVAALASIGLAVAPVGSAEMPDPHPEKINTFFAGLALSGTFERTGPNRYSLEFRDVVDRVGIFAFSGRPATGETTITRLVKDYWQELGFLSNPPTAVVTIQDASESANTILIELDREVPTYKPEGAVLQFESVRLLSKAEGNLEVFEDDADPRIPRRFGTAVFGINDDTAAVAHGCVIQPETICRNANLNRQDLSKTYLAGADFTGSTFRGARLHYVNLDHAELADTNFDNAELLHVTLSYADLRGARFSYLDPFSTHLGAANLTGANLGRSHAPSILRLNGPRRPIICQTKIQGHIYNRDCPKP